MAIAALSGWTREQKGAVAAAYLGWMLDAFDFSQVPAPPLILPLRSCS